MAINYNSKLLDTINKVREGKDQSFTIGYNVSNSFFDSKTGIVNPNLSAENIREEAVKSIQVWANTFSAMYASNKKVKASLSFKIVNTVDNKNDLNIQFTTSSSSESLNISSNIVKISNKDVWRSSDKIIGKNIFNYFTHAVGRLLGLDATKTSKSVMNIFSIRSLDVPNLITNTKVINNIKIKYGTLRYSYPIVFGCTDPKSNNYNPKATRSDKSCVYKN